MEGTWSLLGTMEAARQLGVSQAAVLRYYHSGILRGRKHGRYILIEQRAVLALMKVMDWVKNGKPEPPRPGRAAAAGDDQADDQAGAAEAAPPRPPAEAI